MELLDWIVLAGLFFASVIASWVVAILSDKYQPPEPVHIEKTYRHEPENEESEY